MQNTLFPTLHYERWTTIKTLLLSYHYLDIYHNCTSGLLVYQHNAYIWKCWNKKYRSTFTKFYSSALIPLSHSYLVISTHVVSGRHENYTFSDRNNYYYNIAQLHPFFSLGFLNAESLDRISRTTWWKHSTFLILDFADVSMNGHPHSLASFCPVSVFTCLCSSMSHLLPTNSLNATHLYINIMLWQGNSIDFVSYIDTFLFSWVRKILSRNDVRPAKDVISVMLYTNKNPLPSLIH